MLKLSCETKMLQISFMHNVHSVHFVQSCVKPCRLLALDKTDSSWFILRLLTRTLQQHAHTNTAFLKCFAIVQLSHLKKQECTIAEIVEVVGRQVRDHVKSKHWGESWGC